MPKFSKKQVQYSKGMPNSRCGVCVHFHVGTHTCDVVAGYIRPDMWCVSFIREPDVIAKGGQITSMKLFIR